MRYRPGSVLLFPASAVLRAASLASAAALLVWSLSGCGGGGSDTEEAAAELESPQALAGTDAAPAAAAPMFPLWLYAHANVQRTQRIDSVTPVLQYDRALAFEIEARAGLACARVDQKDGEGRSVTVAYFKRHPGATDQRRLSLWTLDGRGNTPSLDPARGATRTQDDSWVMLPEGTEGDGIIRNFALGGRKVTVRLFADTACTRVYRVQGSSRFVVPVQGVPPVWSLMETLPWPEVSAGSLRALRRLSLDAGATGTLRASWRYAHGSLKLNQLFACSGRRTCGQGDVGRLADTTLRPQALSGTLHLLNPATTPVLADGYKMLGLYGRTAAGLGVQTNYSVCPATPDGQPCLD